MAFPPATDDILDLVDGDVYQRKDEFRFDLKDQNGRVIGELTPNVAQRPRVSFDTNRTEMWSLDNVRLPASQAGDVNAITDRVAAWMILQNGTEFQLGEFLFADQSFPVREWGNEHHVVFTDKLVILDDASGRTGTFAKGRNILDGVLNYARLLIPETDIDYVTSSAVFGAPLTWGPEATYLSRMNDMLKLIGYYPAHFDNAGRLRLWPVPSSMAAAPLDVPPYKDGGRIVRDSIVASNNLLSAPNSFLVYDSSGQGTPKVGRYDLPDEAPHSRGKRGRRITLAESMSGLNSSADAYKAAVALSVTSRKAIYEQRTWETAADPRHGTFNVLDFYGDRYLQQQWTLECVSGGKMNHQARRVYG